MHRRLDIHIHGLPMKPLTSYPFSPSSLCHQPQHGNCCQYHSRQRKGLVMLFRFPCATLQLAHRQSDWLQLHDVELILTCETAESVDHDAKVCYTHASAYGTSLINGFIEYEFDPTCTRNQPSITRLASFPGSPGT